MFQLSQHIPKKFSEIIYFLFQLTNLIVCFYKRGTLFKK